MKQWSTTWLATRTVPLRLHDEAVSETVESLSVCVTTQGCVETDPTGLYVFDDLPGFPNGCSISVNHVSEETSLSYAGIVFDLQTSEGDWLHVDVPLFLDQG